MKIHELNKYIILYQFKVIHLQLINFQDKRIILLILKRIDEEIRKILLIFVYIFLILFHIDMIN